MFGGPAEFRPFPDQESGTEGLLTDSPVQREMRVHGPPAASGSGQNDGRSAGSSELPAVGIEAGRGPGGHSPRELVIAAGADGVHKDTKAGRPWPNLLPLFPL